MPDSVDDVLKFVAHGYGVKSDAHPRYPDEATGDARILADEVKRLRGEIKRRDATLARVWLTVGNLEKEIFALLPNPPGQTTPIAPATHDDVCSCGSAGTCWRGR